MLAIWTFFFLIVDIFTSGVSISDVGLLVYVFSIVLSGLLIYIVGIWVLFAICLVRDLYNFLGKMLMGDSDKND